MHLNGRLGSLRHDIISIDSRIFRTNKFESISVKTTNNTQILKEQQRWTQTTSYKKKSNKFEI